LPLPPAGFRPSDLLRYFLRCRTGVRPRRVLPRFSIAMTIFRDATMCTKSDQTSGRLRVTQAYIALIGIPGSSFAPKTVSVLRVGEYEVRMFNGLPIQAGDAPLWIELFDHVAQMSLDSCSFREIDEAVTAFEEFVSRIKVTLDGA
jgi:hypothetical protein